MRSCWHCAHARALLQRRAKERHPDADVPPSEATDPIPLWLCFGDTLIWKWGASRVGTTKGMRHGEAKLLVPSR